MNENIKFLLVIFVIFIYELLGYYYPNVMIRIDKKSNQFAKESKYHMTSDITTIEFKKDVIKFKNRKKTRCIVMGGILLILCVVMIYNYKS